MNCTKCWVPIDKFTLCDGCFQNYRKWGRDYQDLVNINSTVEERNLYNIGNIWSNQIECKHCWDFIRSKNVHDFVTCTCWRVSVDGWSFYGRIVWNKEDFISHIVEFVNQ